MMKTLALTFALAFGCVVALASSPAWAQDYGTGIFHHTGHGYTGASGHFSYGDMVHNHANMHHGAYAVPWKVYRSGYRGYSTPMRYSGRINAAGQPTGDLYPGMVLPDGAVVVSVGN